MASDKCAKAKGCPCGCAKPRRKRVAKKKNYSGAKMTAPVVPQVINITQPVGVPQMPVVLPRTFMAPINTPNLVPNATKPVGVAPPKPAKYSRVVKPATVIPSAPPVEPLSRYASKLVGIASKPASALTDVGAKPMKEKKKSLVASDVERPVLSNPIEMSKASSSQLKERKSLIVSQPSAPTVLSPDLTVPKVSRYVERSTNKLSSELMNKPETIKRIIKTPTVILPKEKYTPSLSSIQENVLYGAKPGTTELMPIRGGGAGKGGRPKKNIQFDAEEE